MNIVSCDQRSAEWFAARLGKATASRIADIIAVTKSGPSASRKGYAAELVTERLTGQPRETFSNAAMQWGNDTEAEARNAYSFRQDVDVLEVGFVDHPTIPMAGASPDGLIGEDGLLELKCPTSGTHMETLREKRIPAKYLTQMYWQMACTGRQFCDFASYDPRWPESMRLFIKRVHRDEAEITRLENAVSEFLAEVDQTVAQLRAEYERQLEIAA